MAERAISVRLDDQAAAALRALVERGYSQSEAIRVALVEAAAKRRDRSLSAEAARIAADEADRREVAEVRAFMDELHASW